MTFIISCILRQFEDILNFKDHQTCVKEAALLEYFASGFWWAKEMNFNSQQISFIMVLMYSLYHINNLFQHFRLYHSREKQLLKIEKCIEVIDPAEFAAPLEEGMPADLYFYYMAPPRVQTPEQTVQESLEENVEEPGKAELEESPGNHVGFSVEDVREALGEMTQEMLAKLQVYTLESMRVHEETYISRLERLQKASSV
uniref:Ciliary associated calcium binding coiled-coil 1 n=1 Tax=Sinocyclocheilus grahami TaxID=75366 RepID=A0A672PZL8_SINGR